MRARYARISKAALRKARTFILAELGGKGGRSWWAGTTPKERRVYFAKLKAARAAKRQASLNKAA